MMRDRENDDAFCIGTVDNCEGKIFDEDAARIR